MWIYSKTGEYLAPNNHIDYLKSLASGSRVFSGPSSCLKSQQIDNIHWQTEVLSAWPTTCLFSHNVESRLNFKGESENITSRVSTPF